MLLLLYSDTNYALEGFTAEYFISPCPLVCPDWKSCNGSSECPCKNSQIRGTQECGQISANESLVPFGTRLGRVGHSAIRIDDVVYIFGGFNLNILLDDLVALNLTSEAADSISANSLEKAEDPRDDTPSARYAHAAAAYKHGFFIHGGRTAEEVTNELWYFDVRAGKMGWRRLHSQNLPRLMYHTMTKTSEDTFYVYGGGSPVGAFSAELYRFSGEDPSNWVTVSSSCCGKLKERSLLAHTTTFWPQKKDRKSVV